MKVPTVAVVILLVLFVRLIYGVDIFTPAETLLEDKRLYTFVVLNEFIPRLIYLVTSATSIYTLPKFDCIILGVTKLFLLDTLITPSKISSTPAWNDAWEEFGVVILDNPALPWILTEEVIISQFKSPQFKVDNTEIFYTPMTVNPALQVSTDPNVKAPFIVV